MTTWTAIQRLSEENETSWPRGNPFHLLEDSKRMQEIGIYSNTFN
jgi:hypothetical protein